MVPVLLLALLSVVPAGTPDHTAAAAAVCVVAHPSVGEEALDLDLLRRIFLLRRRFWPGGRPARPVNLEPTAPLREVFSRVVFGQSVREQMSYWSERYFHGTRPPPSVASEDAVLLFVSRTEGAVGYVSPDRAARLPDGVRLLGCLDAPSS